MGLKDEHFKKALEEIELLDILPTFNKLAEKFFDLGVNETKKEFAAMCDVIGLNIENELLTDNEYRELVRKTIIEIQKRLDC